MRRCRDGSRRAEADKTTSGQDEADKTTSGQDEADKTTSRQDDLARCTIVGMLPIVGVVVEVVDRHLRR